MNLSKKKNVIRNMRFFSTKSSCVLLIYGLLVLAATYYVGIGAGIFISVLSFVICLYGRICAKGITINHADVKCGTKDIRVRDFVFPDKNKNYREMWMMGSTGIYSRTPLNRPDILMLHHYFKDIGDWLFPDGMDSALVLGGAGCSIPYYLAHRYDNIQIEAVELSKDLVDAAQRYFIHDDVCKKNIKLYNDDAKKYIERIGDKKYSLVFCDIFDGGVLADIVLEPEFVNSMMNHVAQEGILVVNLYRPNSRVRKFLELCKECGITCHMFQYGYVIAAILTKGEDVVAKRAFTEGEGNSPFFDNLIYTIK